MITILVLLNYTNVYLIVLACYNTHTLYTIEMLYYLGINVIFLTKNILFLLEYL